jgi:hypothetical protein
MLDAFRYARKLGLLAALALTSIGLAKQPGDEPLDAAFTRITKGGNHLTVITDLPSDADLEALPAIFDQAMPVWCERFKVDPKETAAWQPTLYLMLDRNRFKQAGLIPKEVPEFPYGWQFGDKMWVMEQPSSYYRRHLVLHEGTHWFMFRKYGFYDTPWLTEGIAELLGTHRWSGESLEMGIIPRTREDVPFWGRIKLIRDQCAAGLAPSLEDILQYSNTAHQRVDAYAWSWALTIFLMNHPDTAKVFEALLKQPAMNSREVNRWLHTRFTGKLPRIRSAWRSFVSELDYGYTTEPGMLQLTDKPMAISEETEFEVRSDRSWQATGLTITGGQKIRITAVGEYSVGNQPKPWKCTPAGVTLEYYRGQPLGKLMLVLLQPEKEDGATELVDVIPVGEELVYQPESGGEIFFRVNESAGHLLDNSGNFQVKLSVP